MNTTAIRSVMIKSSFAIVICALAFGVLSQAAEAQNRAGAVYLGTNHSSGNAVAAYRRASDGTLLFMGAFPTGGTGLGTGADPLASQGAVVLDRSGSTAAGGKRG